MTLWCCAVVRKVRRILRSVAHMRLVQARERGLHNTELVLDFRKSGNSTRGHESKSRINV